MTLAPCERARALRSACRPLSQAVTGTRAFKFDMMQPVEETGFGAKIKKLVIIELKYAQVAEKWVSTGQDDNIKSSVMASLLWPFTAASTEWEATSPRYGIIAARLAMIYMGMRLTHTPHLRLGGETDPRLRPNVRLAHACDAKWGEAAIWL